MALKVDDRWLWLGLGIFAFLAVRGISHGLHEVVRLTEVHEKPEEGQRLSQETEDAIKLESLHVLARSQNLDIRNAAIKILCYRFINHTSATGLLFTDLNSSNPTLRARAIKAMRLLDRHTGFGSSSNWSGPEGGQWRLGLPDYSVPPAARSRLREESPEEQALRRRRREAMVLSEGDRPVSQGDIIEVGRPRSEGEREMMREIEAGLRRELMALSQSHGLGESPMDALLGMMRDGERARGRAAAGAGAEEIIEEV